MTFVEDDELIQTLLTDDPNPPFGKGIGVGGTISHLQGLSSPLFSFE